MIEITNKNKLFIDTAEAFNSSLSFLKEHTVESIELSLDEPGTTKEHCVSLVDFICHAYLRRVINISDGYSNCINKKEALTAAIVGRSLIETIAHFHNLLERIEGGMNENNFDQVYHLLASYSLSGGQDLGYVEKDVKLKKLHISDSLKKIDKKYEVVSECYDWLCEFVHPNSSGTTVAFCRFNKEDKKIRFLDKIPLDEHLTPALDASIFLPIFEEDWKRLPVIRDNISINWKPSANTQNLFTG